jgi:hypothetical protein
MHEIQKSHRNYEERKAIRMKKVTLKGRAIAEAVSRWLPIAAA